MTDPRWTVASVHQVHPCAEGGQVCLCGALLPTSRSVSEHIIDAALTPVLADLRRQVEQRMLAASDAASKEADEAVAAHRYGKAFAYNAVLALIEGGGSDD